MSEFKSVISFEKFKDHGNVDELLKQIHSTLLNELKNEDNWELKHEIFIPMEKIILNFVLNKPKSILGKVNRLVGGDTNLLRKKPELDVDIELTYILGSHELKKVVEITEGGGMLQKMNHSLDFSRGITKMVTGYSKKVDNTNSEIHDKISKIIDKTLDVFEKERVVTNQKGLEKIKEGIKPIEFKSEIRTELTKNQNLFSDEHIPKLLKIIDYYSTNLENYMSMYNLLHTDDFVHESQYEVEKTMDMIPIMYNSLKVIEGYVFEMIQSQINGDKITYFTMYNIFEDLGLFLSKGEKLMIENSNKMIDEIGKVNDSINNLIETTIKVGNKISGQLEQVNKKLDLNNFLTGINTYQLYRINNKL